MTVARPLDSGLRRRLARGFAAQGLGQILTLAVQAASVPLFLRAWGQTAYGEWLLLSAVYLYFSVADLGFGLAAANAMAMLVGADARDRAQEVFQSAWAALCAISLSVFVLGMAAFAVLPLRAWLHITTISSGEVRWTLGLLLANVVLAQQGAMFEAAYRCDDRFARGIHARNAVRLAEFGATTGVLLAGGGMVAVAGAALLSRAAVYALTDIDLRRQVPWLRLGFGEARWATVRSLTRPALAANAFPLGAALGGQGVLTLVGVVFGPPAVVAVSTLRTLARMAQVALTGMAEAARPELSKALGAGDRALARELHRRIVGLVLAGAALAAAVALIAGPTAFRLWTGGRVAFDAPTFVLFVLATVPAAVWGASSAVPFSTNRHGGVALAYLACAIATVALAALLAPHLGIRSVGSAALAGEAVMAAFVVRRSRRMLEEES